MRAEADSVVHRARLAPGLADRQVRASGGAERHSGSPSARAISVSVRRRSG